MMKKSSKVASCASRIFNRQTATLEHAAFDPSDAKIRPYKDIPGPGGVYRLPLIGTLLNFKPFTHYTPDNINQLLIEMSEKYGPLFRFQLGKDVVVVADPRDIETVYRNEGKYPTRPNPDLREAYARRTGVKCLDVSTLQGEEWQQLRAPLNKRLLKAESAAYYLSPQNGVADDFVTILANQKMDADELSELFFRFASESIGVVCFNARLGFLDYRHPSHAETMQFLEAAKLAFKMLHRSFTGESIVHGWYKNETYRNFERAATTISQYTRKRILQARTKLEDQVKNGTFDPEEPNLLLSLFSDQSLSENFVTQIVESLYSGGTDSTAGSLQALFYNLARNPDKQGKLYAEVTSVLGRDNLVTHEALTQMPYLRACVKESFRVLYPVSGVVRILPTDVLLSGYRIPAGVQILLGNVIACKNEFTEPDQYIPERWLRSLDGRRRPEEVPKTAVLPFGYGPRNCIGRRFAEQELYLATIKVVQKLKIGLEQGSQNTPFVHRIFLQPSVPIKFIFTLRDSTILPA